MPTSLPTLDPIPLPAPVWLLAALLLLTFALHVVPMTMTLGGGFWAIVAARRASDPAFGEVARRMAKGLPYWTAAAVSTGVAALLFLQVLYGPVFYASSVVIAWPWLSIVGLVLAAYYGYYFRAYRSQARPRAAFWVGAVAWLAFAAVAFLFVSEMTLMLHPERLNAAYIADRTGATLPLAEPTLWPRYLHMLVGGIALGALWVAWLGARTAGEEGPRVLRFAAAGFAAALAVEAAVGLWFLGALPAQVIRAFMGGGALPTAYFAASLVATAIAMWAAWTAWRGEAPARRLGLGAAAAAVVLVLMVLMRDVVRRETLGAAARLDVMRVAPQWPVIALFAVLLVAGVGTLVWMIVAARRALGSGGAQ
jgi:hypothetical protein